MQACLCCVVSSCWITRKGLTEWHNLPPRCASPSWEPERWAEYCIEAFVKQGLVSPRISRATVAHAGQRAQEPVEGAGFLRHGQSRGRPLRGRNYSRREAANGRPGGRRNRPELTEKKLLISVAASVPTDYIERRIKANIPVIRAMPNTPSMVGEGITAIAKGKYAAQKGC